VLELELSLTSSRYCSKLQNFRPTAATEDQTHGKDKDRGAAIFCMEAETLQSAFLLQISSKFVMIEANH
jgi:hypothetical protein